MSYEGGLNSLVAEIRQASENITQGDARMNQRLEGIEQSVNELYRNVHRPGRNWETRDDNSAERKDARELCILKHDLDVPKNEGNRAAYEPTSAEVDAALLHSKALRNLIRHAEPARLDQRSRAEEPHIVFVRREQLHSRAADERPRAELSG